MAGPAPSPRSCESERLSRSSDAERRSKRVPSSGFATPAAAAPPPGLPAAAAGASAGPRRQGLLGGRRRATSPLSCTRSSGTCRQKSPSVSKFCIQGYGYAGAHSCTQNPLNPLKIKHNAPSLMSVGSTHTSAARSVPRPASEPIPFTEGHYWALASFGSARVSAARSKSALPQTLNKSFFAPALGAHVVR